MSQTTVLITLYVLANLIFTTTLQGRHNYPHFAEKAEEARAHES